MVCVRCVSSLASSACTDDLTLARTDEEGVTNEEVSLWDLSSDCLCVFCYRSPNLRAQAL